MGKQSRRQLEKKKSEIYLITCDRCWLLTGPGFVALQQSATGPCLLTVPCAPFRASHFEGSGWVFIFFFPLQSVSVQLRVAESQLRRLGCSFRRGGTSAAGVI